MFGTNTFAQAPFAALSGVFYASAIAEVASAADTTSALPNYLARIFEDVQASDQTSAQTSFFNSVVDTVVATDTPSALYFVGTSLSDSATVTDTALASVNFAVAFSNAASAADGISALPNYLARILEDVQAVDAAPIAGVDVNAQTDEVVVAQDDVLTSFSIFADLSAAAAASGISSADVTFAVSVEDAAATTTTSSARADFVAAAVEVVVAVGVLRSNARFPVSVFESAFGLDTLLGRELWEGIDDTQLADWTDILVPTTIEDIAVFGGGNFGVLPYAGNLTQRYDPNPVFWNEIDDTQDPDWTDIVAV
jgi:hypothetical protein